MKSVKTATRAMATAKVAVTVKHALMRAQKVALTTEVPALKAATTIATHAVAVAVVVDAVDAMKAKVAHNVSALTVKVVLQKA